MSQIIKKLLFIPLFVIMGITGCAQDKDKSMSAGELKEAMTKDTSLVVLDVRNPYELDGPLGKIDGAINIPIQELQNRVDELDKYKDKKIAVICRTGRRSLMGQQILLRNGFKAVNVEGGMVRYRDEE